MSSGVLRVHVDVEEEKPGGKEENKCEACVRGSLTVYNFANKDLGETIIFFFFAH